MKKQSLFSPLVGRVARWNLNPLEQFGPYQKPLALCINPSKAQAWGRNGTQEIGHAEPGQSRHAQHKK